MKQTAACGLLIILFAVLLPSNVLADSSASTSAQAPIIHHLPGTWNGTGTLFGAPAGFTMKWGWVLDGKFLHLAFENRMPRPDAEDRVMTAQAFYRPQGDGRYQGTWFDSRGMVLPLEATVGDSSLTTHWGTPDTEQGKTLYRLVHQDSVEVEDFVMRNGDWMPFGKASYTRDSSRP